MHEFHATNVVMKSRHSLQNNRKRAHAAVLRVIKFSASSVELCWRRAHGELNEDVQRHRLRLRGCVRHDGGLLQELTEFDTVHLTQRLNCEDLAERTDRAAFSVQLEKY